MRTEGKAGSRSGMSLLEVMIALSILAVGLLGLAALQTTAIKGNATADETVSAAYYAQEKIEAFRRTTPFGAIVSSSGITGTPKRPNYASIPTDGAVDSMASKKNVRIYRVWNVDDTTPTLKTITVWSCWQDQNKTWHSVQLVTRKGNVL